MPQVNELNSTRKSPMFLMKSIFVGFPFPTSRSKPKIAIIIPDIFFIPSLSLKKINPSRAINIGAVPIIHPVLDAVVYFNPVTCIHK